MSSRSMSLPLNTGRRILATRRRCRNNGAPLYTSAFGFLVMLSKRHRFVRTGFTPRLRAIIPALFARNRWHNFTRPPQPRPPAPR
jgi:hypothetical protein